jgi:hypothetical protein
LADKNQENTNIEEENYGNFPYILDHKTCQEKAMLYQILQKGI